MAQKEYQRRGWLRGDPIGDGKQGFTYLARRADDSADSWSFVLKCLKRQDDSKARSRMYSEVATLDSLNHPGVVRLVESNAHEFRTKSELYLVTDRVVGPDLHRVVTERGPLPIEEATEILDAVLEILSHCHSLRVVHRDIKPCHVILAGGHRSQPRMIDFGLSFNEELDAESHSTESNDGVGNRFMGLPEHQVGSDDKRDMRSDVTQCVGLLFYLTTGQTPQFILDRNNRKPHERLELTGAIQNVSSEDFKQLQRIFDIGFNFEPDRRWQSSGALQQEIRSLHRLSTPGLDFKTRLEALHSQLTKSPVITRRLQIEKVEESLRRKFESISHDVQQKLSNYIKIFPSISYKLNSPPDEYPMIIGFTINQFDTSRQFHLKHTCHPVGSEIVIKRNESLNIAGAFSPQLHSTEVCRVGLFDPECADRIMSVLEIALMEEVRRLIDHT